MIYHHWIIIRSSTHSDTHILCHIFLFARFLFSIWDHLYPRCEFAFLESQTRNEQRKKIRMDSSFHMNCAKTSERQTKTKKKKKSKRKERRKKTNIKMFVFLFLSFVTVHGLWLLCAIKKTMNICRKIGDKTSTSAHASK